MPFEITKPIEDAELSIVDFVTGVETLIGTIKAFTITGTQTFTLSRRGRRMIERQNRTHPRKRYYRDCLKTVNGWRSKTRFTLDLTDSVSI